MASSPANLSPLPDPKEQQIYEAGAELPGADKAIDLPPGGGLLVAPTYLTFAQLVNLATRSYRWAHDEALRHSPTNALAMRRDPVLFEALRSRQMPTAQLPWHLECEDDKDEAQIEAVSIVTGVIEHIPNFQQLKMHLLEALWFGRAAVQLQYKWDYRQTGKKQLVVRAHRPIHGDKLIFRYSGQIGILVHALFPGEWELTDRGRAHFFTPNEREQILIHRYEPEDSDFMEGELAGSIAGKGLRDRLYWFWWLRAQITSFMMDYLERVGGGGLTIYYYEHGNDRSRIEVQKAAEEQFRNNTILFPRYKDGSTGGPGIERIEPSVAGAQLLEELILHYFDETMRRLILGEATPSDAKGAGLGSGISDFLEGNQGRRIRYDAINLQETLTSDLVAVLQRYNCPPSVPPLRFVFDLDKPNSQEVMEAAKNFFEMGGTLDEESLRSTIGLEKPEPGKTMLAKMGSLQPAGVGAMPTGVPAVGSPGPQMDPSQAGQQPPVDPAMLAQMAQGGQGGAV